MAIDSSAVLFFFTSLRSFQCRIFVASSSSFFEIAIQNTLNRSHAFCTRLKAHGRNSFRTTKNSTKSRCSHYYWYCCCCLLLTMLLQAAAWPWDIPRGDRLQRGHPACKSPPCRVHVHTPGQLRWGPRCFPQSK